MGHRAKDENTEAIPLGFVDPVAFRGDLIDAPGEYGQVGPLSGGNSKFGRISSYDE